MKISVRVLRVFSSIIAPPGIIPGMPGIPGRPPGMPGIPGMPMPPMPPAPMPPAIWAWARAAACALMASTALMGTPAGLSSAG